MGIARALLYMGMVSFHISKNVFTLFTSNVHYGTSYHQKNWCDLQYGIFNRSLPGEHVGNMLRIVLTMFMDRGVGAVFTLFDKDSL